MLDLANAYYEVMDYAEAIKHYEAIRDDLEKLPDRSPADIAAVREYIGACKQALGK